MPETAPSERPESGAIAQLGERLNGIQEVVGSIPIGSTKYSSANREISIPLEYGRHFRGLVDASWKLVAETAIQSPA